MVNCDRKFTRTVEDGLNSSGATYSENTGGGEETAIESSTDCDGDVRIPPFSFHSKEMKISKTTFRHGRMSDVDGRSREPEHLIRFWIPFEMFCCV